VCHQGRADRLHGCDRSGPSRSNELGIAHAKANGDVRTYKGRKPSFSRKQFENAQVMLGKPLSVAEVARITGLTRQTVYRTKDAPAAARSCADHLGNVSPHRNRQRLRASSS
jgi:DNA invertase Pin-like site-specific DNA recombinase